ncbi:MauE/DoxX family redox-associated membrane protein [Chryseobacterium koreense]|uniref:Methylamine utilisation protein MauE domain-containing protein n=1 Tax=Chryseobacterium koreense CCUG 49689 TaxID=1304281 RepID=A0A0J7IW86_9FLAO|nr:MauE/DoxX family redox-associated membrane protein [Chryseobacterium koreense]KMQ70217.1 hypothetical protein ACM44_13485 [Chryseobacterium koreense CCUG 49689]MBB5334791.1 putative membrane protein YphA (DoxX/SURF4 family) [Chryseobacterium koreense]
MKTLTKTIPLAASLFFILLFVYAAASKMLDFENFQVQLAQSPLLSAYAGLISYAVIILEIVVAGLLCFQVTRLIGLYASFALMVAFTVYIYLILHFSDFVPCSCGGILEKMSWQQHLVFNIISVLLAFIGISFIRKDRAHRWTHTAARLAFAAALSAGSMVALFLSSEYIIKKENNFTRRFPHNPVIKEISYDLKVNSYYFAGCSNHKIYLGNHTAPFQFFTIDDSLKTLKTIKIQPDKEPNYRNTQVKISGDRLFFFDGTVPVIYAGDPNDFTGTVKTKSYKNAYFDQLAIIDSSNYYFTALSSATRDKILGYLKMNAKPFIKLRNDILTKKNDGIFETDGRLIIDEENNDVFYVHYYSNKIIKLDLNIKGQNQIKTIDPVAFPDIHTIKLRNGVRKIQGPPPTINRSVAAYSGLIFNESPRMGKFEQKLMWKENFIVDVYKTYPAGYWGSFYISKEKGKFPQMLVTDQYLFVLTDTKIIRYRLGKSLRDSFSKGRRRKPDIE